MNRRDTFKTLFIGAVAGATIGTTTGCKNETAVGTGINELPLYGRTPKEIEHDNKIMGEEYLNEHELATIAILCDIILPATSTAGSATDAEVPAFIEFIVKDLPDNQLPLRGGLMWLDREANQRFDRRFKDLTNPQQIKIIDDIAYPDPDNKKPEMAHGIKFFDLIRGLTVTGYYTSKIGMKDLGYKGNVPNIWDGVPDDVLKKHGLAYEEEWLAKCVDQSKRDIIAEWDEAGKLIT